MCMPDRRYIKDMHMTCENDIIPQPSLPVYDITIFIYMLLSSLWPARIDRIVHSNLQQYAALVLSRFRILVIRVKD